jgi:iron only hydrogenase large subunit-like protein
MDFDLNVNEKYLCLLAPSFVSEFEYPEIVYKLRKLGFDKVLELTFGAKMTNLAYYSVLKESIEKGEKKTWIASPCPTLVNFIRAKYPHLVENLVPVHSPMGCMGLICKKFYPNHKRVFIAPCVTKKLEAKELGTIDYVMTFKELEELFKTKNIPEKVLESEYCVSFDKFYNDYTKIYPISGGLSSTLHYKNIFKEREVLIKETTSELTKIFDGFKDGVFKHYKFLDLLTCRGGCINGPGMIGDTSVSKRRKKVLKYREYAWRYEKDVGRAGGKMDVEDIDFKRTY